MKLVETRYSKYERNEMIPAQEMLEKLAQFYGVTKEEINEEDEHDKI